MLNLKLLISSSCRRQLTAMPINDLGSKIKTLNDNKQYRKALELFDKHNNQDQQSTPVATNQALRACIELGDLRRGKYIHQKLSPYLSNNSYIRTSLIRLYMKSGDLVKAKEIFEKTKTKSVAMFASMINGYADNNLPEESLDIFQRMNIEPNEYIYSSMFKVCVQIDTDRSFEFGKNLWNRIPDKFKNNGVVLTSALYMFLQFGDITTGQQIFSRIDKNVVTYGAMMAGFVSNKMPQNAIDLFFEIAKPNEYIFSIFFKACSQLRDIKALTMGKKVFDQLPVEYNRSTRVMEAALNMFTKCDDHETAKLIFDRLKRNAISYGSMMKMYNMKNEPEKTVTLYEQMKKENIEPDEIIFTLLIDAYSEIGDFKLCQSLVNHMSSKVLADTWIKNGLIDMWGKAGSVEEAKRVFDTIEQPNSICFAAMIHVYGLNGKGLDAIHLFRQIPTDMIDPWIYVCVLNACSHSGLINEAREIFSKIPLKYKTERVYTAMIDTFSRSFMFDEAQKLIHEYEIDHPASVPMHMAMLSGARNKKNAVLSEKIFYTIQKLFPDDKNVQIAASVLLMNSYAAQSDFSNASHIRLKMNQTGGKKLTGLSWTVVDGQIVKFRAHDRSHPRSDEIYAEIDRLTKEMVEHGYKCDASWITRPLMNDETIESVLCGHSERLAIAFNLIQRPVPSQIQVVKNLRVCGDCHEATKLIARIRKCSIIVRDANRIHHFSPDGQCSCDDHF